MSASDALRTAGFAAWHRPREACPECGWTMRQAENDWVCDICHLVVTAETPDREGR